MNRRLAIGALLLVAAVVMWFLGSLGPDTPPSQVAGHDSSTVPAVPPTAGSAPSNEPPVGSLSSSPTSQPSPPSAPGVAASAPGSSASVSNVAPSAPLGAMQPAPIPANPVAGSGPPAPSPAGDIMAELDNVQFAIRDFRTALRENPIGNNAEITKALLGDNLKQVRMSIPAGSSVNGDGELCDRWGTPYFFHALSKMSMEVRSAGDDRKMWTGDDLITK